MRIKPNPMKAMKGQSAMEYVSTYGWAFIVLIILLGIIFQLGLFNAGQAIVTSAEVVGFNSFNINNFLLRSSGALELTLSNRLEDTVTIKEIDLGGSPLTGVTPALPFNISAGSNVTIHGTSSLTSSGSRVYNARVGIKFDVDRGTADHLDAGFLKGEFQPG
ncbi:Uncharacterised protein [Candidatus Burarchaeum australiense]|nr:Uncharacterised protein [Candidatus Burarchaeum australiense]